MVVAVKVVAGSAEKSAAGVGAVAEAEGGEAWAAAAEPAGVEQTVVPRSWNGVACGGAAFHAWYADASGGCLRGCRRAGRDGTRIVAAQGCAPSCASGNCRC